MNRKAPTTWLSFLFLFFGLFTLDVPAPWCWINSLYLLPLLCFLAGWRKRGIVALVVAGVLSLPSVFALAPRPNYLTLPKRFHFEAVMEPGILPGVAGLRRITTDEQGFRVSPPVDYAKPKGFRIFAIGGSTTESLYLDDEKTWPHLLQEELARAWNRPVEVINTGVSGLRAVNHLATLQAIRPLHPDAVIFLLGFNDANRQIKDHFATPWRTFRTFREKIKPSQNWRALALVARLFVASHASKPHPVEDRAEFIVPKRGSLYRSTQYDWQPTEVPQAYHEVLNKISATCREMGVPCLFVSQTSSYHEGVDPEFQKLFWMTPPDENYTLTLPSLLHFAKLYNQDLAQFARQHGHPFCDIFDWVAAGPEHFYDDCHFNDAGAALAAHWIAECVKAELK